MRSNIRDDNSHETGKGTKASRSTGKATDSYSKIMDMVETRASNHDAYFLFITADNVVLKAALKCQPKVSDSGLIAVADAHLNIVAFNDRAKSLKISLPCPLKFLLKEYPAIRIIS